MTSVRVGGIVGLAVLLSVPVAAQWFDYPTAGVPRTPAGKPDLFAPAPRAADGKPDLSGVWEMEHNLDMTPSGVGCRPVSLEFRNIGSSLERGLPYQPWAADVAKARRADPRLNPLTRGLPIGIVRLHTHPTFRRVMQTAGMVVILSEYSSTFRQIFTDGRPLPTDPNPAWYGYSTGHWDGETLVVTTTGFHEDVWLDSAGSPLSETATIVERFHRVNYGTLHIELTVDDPKVYTKPWTVTLTQVIALDTELLETFFDNEKDLQHMQPITTR